MHISTLKIEQMSNGRENINALQEINPTKINLRKPGTVMKQKFHNRKQEYIDLRETKSTASSGKQLTSRKPNVQDFKKIRLLGQGKYGNVYLVSHKVTGFIGAIKIIQKRRVTQDPKLLSQLFQEIKLQSYMKNSNIIQLYSSFSDDHTINLLMELGCDGQLYSLMNQKPRFHQQTTSFITRELLEGLIYIHRLGIIHRDLKPQNIVLVHGIPKICDFGWSVHCPNDLRSTFCGTPLYLSPQILTGQSYNDKIDTWALGALTYEMFTGETPFRITKKEELQKIVSQSFKMRTGSPQIKHFIGSTLCKDPTNRPDSNLLRQHPFILKYQGLETADELCS